MLGNLTFLSPLWAMGLLASVGLPVLAHLLSDRGGRSAVIPTVRFIERASAEVARVLRPRHWLLMALRIAALGAVVAAFTQPIWQRHADADAARQGYLVAVVVDRSASMHRVDHGATLFEEAVRRADVLLARLDPARDQAAVILLDRRPRSLLPDWTANFSLLSEQLTTVEPTLERGELSEALTLVREMARRDESDRRLRVELITDGQRTQWSPSAAALTAQLGGALVVSRVGDEAGNASLSRPHADPPRPIVGQPAAVSVDVVNHSPDQRNVAVVMEHGGLQQRRLVRVAPWSAVPVTFPVQFTDAGLETVSFRIEDDDALSVDDTTGLVLRVAERRPVVIVTDSDTDDPRTAAYFIHRGIDPQRGGELAGVDVTVVSGDQLTDFTSTGEQPVAFILVETVSLNPDQLAWLQRRVADGDGLVWIAGRPADAAALSAFHELADGRGAPILPAGDTPFVSSAARGLGTGRFDHDILHVFEGPARSGLLSHTFVRSMQGTLGPTAEPLLSFDDGHPALAVGWAGAGRVAVLAADVAPDSTQFVKDPSFVPLLHQLIRNVAPGPPVEASPQPGGVLTPTAGDDQRWLGPDNEPLPQTNVDRIPDTGPHWLVDARTAQRSDGKWVELDPAESDLRIVESREAGLADIASTGGAAALRPVGVELWPYLALAGLLLLLSESLLLLRFEGARPRGGEAAA